MCERKCIVFQVTHKFISVTIRQDGVVVKDIAVRATHFDSSPGEIRTQCRQRVATVATFIGSCVAQALTSGMSPATVSRFDVIPRALI